MTPVATAALDMTAASAPEAPRGDTPQVIAWVQAAQAGDRSAFDALVGHHYRAVYRTAMAALQRPEDAEDATQDAFVLAWRKIGAFRGDASFKTWLLTIVWRQALDRRRRRDRWWKALQAPVVAQDGTTADAVDGLVAPAADPERIADGRGQLAAAQAAIAALSPTLRDTLLLASSGDYSYEEIAVMVGRPVGTVKWRVAEARRILKCR